MQKRVTCLYYDHITFIGSLIGSLKAGFVTEGSGAGSCRAIRFQYPILKAAQKLVTCLYYTDLSF